MKKLLLALTVVLVALPLTAGAQVNRRQHEQRQRIEQGIRRSSLTKREAARIRAREAAIRARERRDRRDGHGLTFAERRRLQREQNRVSHRIYQQKHDRQHRH